MKHGKLQNEPSHDLESNWTDQLSNYKQGKFMEGKQVQAGSHFKKMFCPNTFVLLVHLPKLQNH